LLVLATRKATVVNMRLDEISSSLKGAATMASIDKWRNAASEYDQAKEKHGTLSPEADPAYKKYTKAGNQMGRLSVAHSKSSPLAEGPFDDMVNQLSNVPKKGPGRWPGSKDKKPAGSNYSGELAKPGVRPVKRSKDLDQLKYPEKKK